MALCINSPSLIMHLNIPFNEFNNHQKSAGTARCRDVFKIALCINLSLFKNVMDLVHAPSSGGNFTGTTSLDQKV